MLDSRPLLHQIRRYSSHARETPVRPTTQREGIRVITPEEYERPRQMDDDTENHPRRRTRHWKYHGTGCSPRRADSPALAANAARNATGPADVLDPQRHSGRSSMADVVITRKWHTVAEVAAMLGFG